MNADGHGWKQIAKTGCGGLEPISPTGKSAEGHQDDTTTCTLNMTEPRMAMRGICCSRSDGSCDALHCHAGLESASPHSVQTGLWPIGYAHAGHPANESTLTPLICVHLRPSAVSPPDRFNCYLSSASGAMDSPVSARLVSASSPWDRSLAETPTAIIRLASTPNSTPMRKAPSSILRQ